MSNPQAFPRPYSINEYWEQPLQHEAQPGMSLRDWFAGQAITGILMTDHTIPADDLATDAYAVADAMLKEREKT